VTANIEGLEELVAEFRRADRTVIAGAELVLDKVAGDVTATAQSYVPVDTGATKSSIHASTPGALRREVGPTTEYAPHLEYGTSVMAPYAFMGPALDRHSPEFAAAMRQLGGEVLW
jgi:HK97 gp10 family phage protein